MPIACLQFQPQRGLRNAGGSFPGGTAFRNRVVGCVGQGGGRGRRALTRVGSFKRKRYEFGSVVSAEWKMATGDYPTGNRAARQICREGLYQWAPLLENWTWSLWEGHISVFPKPSKRCMQRTKWQDDPRVGHGTQTNGWTCTKARKAQGGEEQFRLGTSGRERSPGRLPRSGGLGASSLRMCGRRKKCNCKQDAAETK